MGKPGYTAEELVDEFEELVGLLEIGGHIEPDAGRIIRSALSSSKKVASDTLTPLEEIVSARTTSTVSEVLKLMGGSNHTRLPVYDNKGEFVGAITFRSVSRAIAEGKFDDLASAYMTQAARVESDDSVAVIMDRMQKAGTAIAFVYDDEGRMVGMVTLTDILEQLLGIKI